MSGELLERLPRPREVSITWPTGSLAAGLLTEGPATIELDQRFRVALFRSSSGVLLQVEQVRGPTERVRVELWAEGPQLKAIRSVLTAERPPGTATVLDDGRLIDAIAGLRTPLASHGAELWQAPGGALAPKATLGEVSISALGRAGVPARIEGGALVVPAEGHRHEWTGIGLGGAALAGFAVFAMQTITLVGMLVALAIAAPMIFFGRRRIEREVQVTPHALTSTLASRPLQREGVGFVLPATIIHGGPLLLAHDGRPIAVIPRFAADGGDAIADAMAQAWHLPPVPPRLYTGSGEPGENAVRATTAHLLQTFRAEHPGAEIDQSAETRVEEAARKAIAELERTPSTAVSLPFLTADETGPKHLDLTLDRAFVARLEEPGSTQARDAALPAWFPPLDDAIRIWRVRDVLVAEGLCLDLDGSTLFLFGDQRISLARARVELTGRGKYRRIRIVTADSRLDLGAPDSPPQDLALLAEALRRILGARPH